MASSPSFKGRHFEPSVILLCVRWYLSYALSYRDLQALMAERGLRVDASTIYRWVQRYAPDLDRRIRRRLQPTRDAWHVDETYLRVKGKWAYLYRAVDGQGQTVEFMLSARRDTLAAKRFLERALQSPHNGTPATVVVDKNPTYPAAMRILRSEGHLDGMTRLCSGRWLNNRIEQDHRGIKRLVRPGLGFKTLPSASRTIQGYETMAMVRKGQVAGLNGRDGRAVSAFVEELFGIGA